MAKNILDDEILKRNQQIARSLEKREEATQIVESINPDEPKVENTEIEGHGDLRKRPAFITKLLDDEGNLIDPDEADEETEYTEIYVPRKGEVEIPSDGTLRNNQSVFITKLLDDEGNLIDPDEADEETEYQTVYILRRDKKEIEITGENYDFNANVRDYVVDPSITNFPTVENAENFKIRQELPSNEEVNDGIEYTTNIAYDNDFWSNGIGAFLGSRAETVDAGNEESYSVTDLEQREKIHGDSMAREMSIFLYMLFPYIGTSTALSVDSTIDSVQNGGANPVGLIGAGLNAYYLLRNLLYFTPAEFLLYFGNNFYTLWLFKRMTAKYPNNAIPFGARSWDGEPDLFFGRDTGAFSLMKTLQSAADSIAGSTDGAGDALRSRARKGDNLLGEDGSSALYLNKDGGPGDAREATDNSGFMLTGGKTASPLSPKINISLEKSNADKIFSSPVGILTGVGDVNERTQQREWGYVAFSLPDFKVDQASGKWTDINRDEDPNKRGNFSFSANVDNRLGNHLDIRNRTSAFEEETLDANNPFVLNDGVFNINLAANRTLDGEAFSGSLEEAAKYRDRFDDSKFKIGSLLVTPIGTQDDNLEKYWIPFEFNPQIDEGDSTASYEASNVLSRIGAMQTYSYTDLFTVTITTNYLALSSGDLDDEDGSGNAGHSWMNDYTMRDIQAIEMAYRSLVMPMHPDETDESNGYRYIKPPVIRVVMGDAWSSEGEDGVYSNLLNYQTNEMFGDNGSASGRLNSAESLFGNKRKFRSFIATGVSIKKNLQETPVRLDSKGLLLDTMGFEVNLSLTQVTTSYMDTYPDLKSLAGQYISNINNNFRETAN